MVEPGPASDSEAPEAATPGGARAGPGPGTQARPGPGTVTPGPPAGAGDRESESVSRVRWHRPGRGDRSHGTRGGRTNSGGRPGAGGLRVGFAAARPGPGGPGPF
jgi:hypothetical protein